MTDFELIFDDMLNTFDKLYGLLYELIYSKTDNSLEYVNILKEAINSHLNTFNYMINMNCPDNLKEFALQKFQEKNQMFNDTLKDTINER